MTTNNTMIQEEGTQHQALENNKGEIKMKNNMIVFNKEDIAMMQDASIQIQQLIFEQMGINNPSLTTFIGEGADRFVVDLGNAMFTVTIAGETRAIPFHTQEAKQLNSFLMLQLPGKFSKFKETEQYKAMEAAQLESRLTAKAKVQGKKVRETVLMGMMKIEDVYVVSEGKVMDKLTSFDEDDLFDTMLVGNEADGFTMDEDIQFVIAKDARLDRLAGDHTMYQKISGSLSAHRYAVELGKDTVEIKVKKEISMDGMILSINEPQNAIVLDEMLVLDGSGNLPFGDFNQTVLRSVFSEISIVQSSTGELEFGDLLSDLEVVKTYKAYTKSMSQARSGGAIGFDSIENAARYFKATGQDDRAYGANQFIVDAMGNMVPTGKKVLDVAKAYKRFMMGASNGLSVDKGFLSTFRYGHTVQKFTKAINGLEFELIEMTNFRGEKYRIAITDDFYAQVDSSQDFLLNVIDEDNAMVGVEEFKEWTNEEAIKNILMRNVTDGGGWTDSKTVGELRKNGVLNSFDAFQLRVSHTVKGAMIEFDAICELFGANMVLTEGMVKGKQIDIDLQENGFQLFVVGQRKDSPDGVWVASQAIQQMGLSVEDLKRAVDKSVEFSKLALEGNSVSDLIAMIGATDEEHETELAVVDYIRLAKEVGDVLDEQYIKDQGVQLAVRKLNKLLDAKVYAEEARVRYMFTDPIAIFNAAKRGSYILVQEDAALKPYEIITPSKNEDGEFYQQTGKALSVRFPVTVTHEIPIMNAIESNDYTEHVEKGLWQGCTFFDAFSWAAPQQAGADFDGDASIIIFDELLVSSRERQNAVNFGFAPVLPFIDVYVKYIDGVAVEFKEGSPTYEVASNDEVEEIVKQEINGFDVEDNTIIYDQLDVQAPARKMDLLRTMAILSQDITVSTIETSLIGLIANRAMILTDLLTRDVLTADERMIVQRDLLVLTTAGRWEIDRPKHGGAYLEMPLIDDLFKKFDSYFFSEDEMTLSDEQKQAIVTNNKGIYIHLFGPSYKFSNGKRNLVGFNIKKPQWLASQKDEYGKIYNDSSFELAFGSKVGELDHLSYSEVKIQSFCDEHSIAGSKNNNIRGRVYNNMEVAQNDIENVKGYVSELYESFKAKEDSRRNHENVFRAEATQTLKENGAFVGKNMESITKAKVSAKIRKEYKAEMTNFSVARDLFKAEFRKEMYIKAKEVGVDVRSMVGALYIVISETKTNSKATASKDGREYRFVASNGFIALPFELFAEEMNSLISGKVSETYFIPQDTTFTLLQSRLVEGLAQVGSSSSSSANHNSLRVRVMNPSPSMGGKAGTINSEVQVAIKPETQKGETVLVMYILNKGVELEDATEVTREQAAYIGFPPAAFAMMGVYPATISHMSFDDKGETAVITIA